MFGSHVVLFLFNSSFVRGSMFFQSWHSVELPLILFLAKYFIRLNPYSTIAATSLLPSSLNKLSTRIFKKPNTLSINSMIFFGANNSGNPILQLSSVSQSLIPHCIQLSYHTTLQLGEIVLHDE